MTENLENLTVLHGLSGDKVFAAFAGYTLGKNDFSELLRAVFAFNAENDFCKYVTDLILFDENPLSLCLASHKQPSEYLKSAYLGDLRIIFNSLATLSSENYFEVGKTDLTPEEFYDKAAALYPAAGFGRYLKYTSFTYEKGDIVPIEHINPISLEQLKDYKFEKRQIEENVKAFLSDLPYANMLLYGDRGTGKSSSVHAMVKKYAESGLRLIELSPKNINLIREIKDKVNTLPMKFIIFIDDLSLQDNDERLTDLKANLEGSCRYCGNAMVVATSNRRHVVRENRETRENAVHVSDELDEQLSLSDRFGLTVMFSATSKDQYLSIVKQLAEDAGVTPDEQLLLLAERWAVCKGGRSPRRARQFIDFWVARARTGSEIDF